MTIHPDQILLLAILVFFVLYVSVLRTTLTDRLMYFLFALAGVSMVINPDLTTRVAQIIGIGRGADLLFYLFMLFGLFYSASINAELRRTRHQLTMLVREIAIQNAEEGAESSHQ